MAEPRAIEYREFGRCAVDCVRDSWLGPVCAGAGTAAEHFGRFSDADARGVADYYPGGTGSTACRARFDSPGIVCFGRHAVADGPLPSPACGATWYHDRSDFGDIPGAG